MMEISTSPVAPCLIRVWESSQVLLRQSLLKQSGDGELTADILQETFIRALNQENRFCLIQNQQAWLFKVASNLLTDELRRNKKLTTEDDVLLSLPQTDEEILPVDNLAQCLPKAFTKLSAEERDIIESCDLRGLKQPDYAAQHGISLSATKSRIQRARVKLRQILKCQCNITFDEQHQVCCFYPETDIELKQKNKPHSE